METARWEKIEELLQAALDQDVSQRASFLEKACAGDTDLNRQVQTLLNREAKARSFIETPASAHLSATSGESTSAPLIGRKIGHYRIESLIGAGGMGEVYKAHDENLRRTVALKVLSAEFVTDAERVIRFEREAFTVSRLNHPNIITIFEIARADQEQFIVSEYIEGETLRQFLTTPLTKEPRRLPINRALDIAMQVASALKAAHTAWIIHRDIKPENIMVRSDGVVKVLDFGIAKLGETAELEPISQG